MKRILAGLAVALALGGPLTTGAAQAETVLRIGAQNWPTCPTRSNGANSRPRRRCWRR